MHITAVLILLFSHSLIKLRQHVIVICSNRVFSPHVGCRSLVSKTSLLPVAGAIVSAMVNALYDTNKLNSRRQQK